MAKQVEPFSVPITLGYRAFCLGDDFLEEDGPVYFDEPPELGDTAVLSDGKLWSVVKKSNEEMELIFEI